MRGEPTARHGHALRKGRLSISGQLYLVTTVTHKRDSIFEDLFAGRRVVQELVVSNAKTLAFVVMPDHLHWLLKLQDQPLRKIMQRFKARSAIGVNQILSRSGSVWQHGYYDHALRKDEDIQTVARYIAANPLRAGLVEGIGDYPLWDAIWL